MKTEPKIIVCLLAPNRCPLLWLQFRVVVIMTLVQFSRSVMSDSLQLHELQNARLPCPSPTPRACSNSTLIESLSPTNYLILSPPSPAFNLSQNQGLFQWICSSHLWWPKYCSFSFSIGLSNEYSGLISFRMDRLDLLEVQGTLKSLLQHPNSKASILRCQPSL